MSFARLAFFSYLFKYGKPKSWGCDLNEETVYLAETFVSEPSPCQREMII